MKFLPAPFTPSPSGRSKLQRARALSRYASGPIRITLRSVEVIPDRPEAKTETFQVAATHTVRPRKSPAVSDRTVFLLL
jgi:hypothetical protein